MRLRHAHARTAVRGFLLEPLATDAVRPAERMFMEKAGALSRLQVRFAEMGVAQGTNADVRSFAQQVVADHRALAESIEALVRRKGAGLPTGPAADTSVEALQELGAKSGAEFDRAFIRALAARHDELMTLFEQTASDSRDADVRALAAAQLPNLRAHRNTLIELKKSIE